MYKGCHSVTGIHLLWFYLYKSSAGETNGQVWDLVCLHECTHDVADQKPRMCWGMIGFKGNGIFCSSMLMHINGLLGQRWLAFNSFTLFRCITWWTCIPTPNLCVPYETVLHSSTFSLYVHNSQDWPSLWAPICNMVLQALSYLSLVFYKFLVYRGFLFHSHLCTSLKFPKKSPQVGVPLYMSFRFLWFWC